MHRGGARDDNDSRLQRSSIVASSVENEKVTEQKKSIESSSGERLVEEVDYYIENGLYVFTEHYLLKRGYCCQSGCRHCPYGFAGGKVGANK